MNQDAIEALKKGPLGLLFQNFGMMLTRDIDLPGALTRLLLSVRTARGYHSKNAAETFNIGRSDTEAKEYNDTVLSYLQQEGFTMIDYDSPGRFCGIKFDLEDPDIPLCTIDTWSVGAANLHFYGDATEVDKHLDHFRSVLKKPDINITIMSLDDETKKCVSRTRFLSQNDIAEYHPEAYPWMAVDLKMYFEKFMDADENVLIIYGPPGTGKSSFLRQGLLQARIPAMLSYSSELLRRESTIHEYMDSDRELLIYEDCDDFLMAREEGNPLMATILNSSQGIVRSGRKKFVFSSNLSSTSKIDSALLRDGRCFDILHFRNLAVSEAEIVRQVMGMPPADFRNLEHVSLAQATRRTRDVQVTENRFAKSFGF